MISQLFSLYINIIILELLACGWCWCELVNPVPMLTVDSSCHSLLLVELFIDAFTIFSWVLFGLAAQNLGARPGIFGCTYVHTSLWNKVSYTQSKMGGTYTYMFNPTDHTICQDRSYLLFLTPSVGHTTL